MKSIVLLMAITSIGGALLAGCASDGETTKWTAEKEKQTVTGSNIPRRDTGVLNIRVASKEELERIQSTSQGTPVTNP